MSDNYAQLLTTSKCIICRKQSHKKVKILHAIASIMQFIMRHIGPPTWNIDQNPRIHLHIIWRLKEK